MSKNKDIWESLGITESGHELCDHVYPLILEAMKEARRLGDEDLAVFHRLVGQARFEVNELPKRTLKYQEEWRFKP